MKIYYLISTMIFYLISNDYFFLEPIYGTNTIYQNLSVTLFHIASMSMQNLK